MTREQVEALAADLDEPVMLLEPAELYDQAIVGVARRFNSYFVVYDQKKVLEALAQDSTDEEEDPEASAQEYFDFNVIGAWVGEGTPAFIETEAPDA